MSLQKLKAVYAVRINTLQQVEKFQVTLGSIYKWWIMEHDW